MSTKNRIMLACILLVSMAVPALAQDAILSPGDFIIAIQTNRTWGKYPPAKAIDGTLTKYFNKASSGLIVTADSYGSSVIGSFQITTGNDREARDPASWELYGTNDTIVSAELSDGTAENWTLIDSGSLSLPSARNTLGPMVNVSNSTQYTSYKIIFPTNKGDNKLQFAEMQFYTAGGDTTPPDPPTGLSATPGDATVSLDWNDNSEPDLDDYTVYRSTTSGSGYGAIATDVANSDYVDNTAANGTTYYYVVTATDTSSNESGYSNEDSATPIDTTPPAAPTGLIVTPGDSSMSLNWDDNSEPDLDSYTVYRSTTSGSGYSSIATDLITSDYVDNTAVNYTTYYYVVTATDTSDNESAYSSEASGAPVDMTPPAAPTGLAATPGDGSVSLDWNDNSEPDLDDYTVYRSTTSGSGYSAIATDVADSDYVDNTVTNGTTYYYVVTATDTNSNESGYSTEASATPVDSTPPAAPTGLAATPGDASVSLDWNDNSEPDLDDYIVYRSTTSGSGYSAIAADVANSDYVDNTAANGTTYYYVVTAEDTSGNESGDSNEASATPIDTTPPAAPTGLSANPGDGSVSLNWADNSEPDLDSYTVYRSTTSGSGYGLVAADVTNSDYVDNTVTNDVTYYYVVTAIDTASNESGYSSEVSATPTSGGSSMPDPIVYWALDDSSGTTATDSSGNGNHGTLYGDLSFDNDSVPGCPGNDTGTALDFDGGNDYVGYSLTESTWPAYSVALWAKANALGQAEWKSIFNNNSSSSDFQIDVDGISPGSYRYLGSSGEAYFGTVTTDWVHLAVTCDGTDTKLYYNGIYVTTIAGAADSNFGQYEIGRNRGGNKYFNGSIDEVYVYDLMLDDYEVATLYAGSTPTNIAPIAQPQQTKTRENTPKGIVLVAIDLDGDDLDYFIVDNPDHGDLTGTAPDVTYTPDLDYRGYDTFTFMAYDGELYSNTATATIRVTSGPLGDVTFFMIGDTHMASDTLSANRFAIDEMNALAGAPYPVSVGGGVIDTPRGLCVSGDLTDNGTSAQWTMWVDEYGLTGENRCDFTMYEGWGNHDGSDCRLGIQQRNLSRPGLMNISSNGYHYSWNWDHVHFVQLNIYAGNSSTAQASLSFLIDDLNDNVGATETPVVIFQHYNIDDNDNWWSSSEKTAFYNAIENYNVVGIFTGHSHVAKHLVWNGIDSYNPGATKAGDGRMFVVHIEDDFMTVIYRKGGDWDGTIWDQKIISAP